SLFGLVLGRTTEATVNNMVISYEAGRTVAVTKLVQPLPIEIDPPAFVYVAASQYDLTKIAGPLTVIGGDSAEGAGDLLVVHNQEGSSDESLLVNRVAPRMIQNGEDQNGNPLFKQDVDSNTKAPLFDVYMSLEGMGLQPGIGPDGVRYWGARLFGFERVDLRLSNGRPAVGDDGSDNLTVALNQYRGVNTQNQILLPAQVPASAPSLEFMQIQIVAGAGDDEINLLHYRGQVVVLGGAGNDTVNVGDRGLLNGVLGTLVYDGDAHIREIKRQAVRGDFPSAVLDNLPSVFVDTDSTKTLVDRGGNFFTFASPTLASVVFSNGINPTDLLWINAVVLANAPVQERGVQERGIQKTTSTGTPLWLALNGNETIDQNATGIPVIERSTAAGAQLVFITNTGKRVFAAQCVGSVTCTQSIVPALAGETAVDVFRDANGRKTLAPTTTLPNGQTIQNRPSYRVLKGDLIEDLVQLTGSTVNGVQEYGVQAEDPNTGDLLWMTLDGKTTTNEDETGIPIINTAPSSDPDARLVYINEAGLRVFVVTPIPSIVLADVGAPVYVDIAGDLYLTSAPGRRPMFRADFENG
ncbi:MAG TPA: hypothetical protein VL916_12285, partial [Ilumatobacteraceae bacterium]|nr:hypothetical protein [Ilumatobacteraceae bacterium]